MNTPGGRCLWLISLCAAACLELFCSPKARADFPTELSVSEVDAVARQYDCEKVSVDMPASAFLLLPRGPQDNPDGKYHQPYHAVCHAYVQDPDSRGNVAAGYSQRFIIYGAAQESKPEMVRAARLLLMLWDEERVRMHHDHTPDEPTVHVWLCEQPGAGLSPDTGGEQFKSEIYVYDVLRGRRPIEWAREVAHEYGHYALPGISGFRAPEEWANGVLGERLYLNWISDDIRAGKIPVSSMPYVTTAELNEYVAKQVTPLIHRVDSRGAIGLDLARRDAEGMDNYVALALYIDHFYGSRQLLSAMSYTAPSHRDVLAEAPDFLRGFLQSVRSTPDLKMVLEERAGSLKPIYTMYLLAGQYSAEPQGRVLRWKAISSGKDVLTFNAHSLRVTQSGWYRIELELEQGSDGIAQLLLNRQGRG